MSKNKKGKIYYSMQAISILPLLLYGILIIFFSTYYTYDSSNNGE